MAFTILGANVLSDDEIINVIGGIQPPYKRIFELSLWYKWHV